MAQARAQESKLLAKEEQPECRFALWRRRLHEPHRPLRFSGWRWHLGEDFSSRLPGASKGQFPHASLDVRYALYHKGYSAPALDRCSHAGLSRVASTKPLLFLGMPARVCCGGRNLRLVTNLYARPRRREILSRGAILLPCKWSLYLSLCPLSGTPPSKLSRRPSEANLVALTGC